MQQPGQDFARSKPPGQLLFYMGLASLADAFMPAGVQESLPTDGVLSDRHRRLAHFASLVLPWLATLALIPLTVLAARFLPRELVLYPAALYLLAPPTALITLHLDQALYPLLATLTWALAAQAGGAAQRGWAWGASAGVAAWLCVFVSFSLLPAIPLAAVFAWAATETGDRLRKARRLLPTLLGFLLAFVFLAAMAWHGAGYDMVDRFCAAMAHHGAWIIAHHPDWEGWPESLPLRLLAAVLNLLEFGYWSGIPLIGLYLWSVVAAARLLFGLRIGRSELTAIAVGVLLAAAGLFGGSIGETARLWIFMLPAVVLVAADRLKTSGGHRVHECLLAVAANQLAWMFLLKAKQDFW
jgi:hypothetical protein